MASPSDYESFKFLDEMILIQDISGRGVQTDQNHVKAEERLSQRALVGMEETRATEGATGASTPESADAKVDIDYAAHFAKLNEALRLTPTPNDLCLPTVGRPDNFGVVMKDVYRSSFPTQDNYSYFRQLKLKSVLTLVKKDEDEAEPFTSFLAASDIRHHVIDMKGTKKEAISLSMMRQIIGIVLDKSNHPMLIHCNKGRHRTGCVVGVLRKLSNWDLTHVLAEYRGFAYPKPRETDIEYLSSFDITHLPNYFHTVPISTLARAAWDLGGLHGLFRTVHFIILVLGLWFITLLTGKRVDVDIPKFLALSTVPSPLPESVEETS